MMRREEHYIGRRAMEMKVQGSRKRGIPRRRWLDKVKDDIKEKGLSADVCHCTSTQHKSGNKMKRKKNVQGSRKRERHRRN